MPFVYLANLLNGGVKRSQQTEENPSSMDQTAISDGTAQVKIAREKALHDLQASAFQFVK